MSRCESASPATGSAHAHKLEQAQLVARAFGDREPEIEDVIATKKSATQPDKEEQSDSSANEIKGE